MTDDVETNVVELIDRDEQIFRLRLAGLSERRIARQFGLRVAQIEAIVAGQCQPVTKQSKARTFELELARLDEMQAAFFAAARRGDAQAAAICLKINERRSAMLGFDMPTTIRTDPVMVAIEAAPRPTSTERIRQLIDAIVAERERAEPPDGEQAPPNP